MKTSLEQGYQWQPAREAVNTAAAAAQRAGKLADSVVKKQQAADYEYSAAIKEMLPNVEAFAEQLTQILGAANPVIMAANETLDVLRRREGTAKDQAVTLAKLATKLISAGRRFASVHDLLMQIYHANYDLCFGLVRDGIHISRFE